MIVVSWHRPKLWLKPFAWIQSTLLLFFVHFCINWMNLELFWSYEITLKGWAWQCFFIIITCVLCYLYSSGEDAPPAMVHMSWGDVALNFCTFWYFVICSEWKHRWASREVEALWMSGGLGHFFNLFFYLAWIIDCTWGCYAWCCKWYRGPAEVVQQAKSCFHCEAYIEVTSIN